MEVIIILIVMTLGLYTLNKENKKRKRSGLSVELLNPKYEYRLIFTSKDGITRELKLFSDRKHEISEILNFFINNTLNVIELKECDKSVIISLSEIRMFEIKEFFNGNLNSISKGKMV